MLLVQHLPALGPSLRRLQAPGCQWSIRSGVAAACAGRPRRRFAAGGSWSRAGSRESSRSRSSRSRTRAARGLSERMMTGQPAGAKLAAMASARAPAQSRNVSPAISRTSRSVRLSTALAACISSSLAAQMSRSPRRVSVLTGPSRTALIARTDFMLLNRLAWSRRDQLKVSCQGQGRHRTSRSSSQVRI